MAKTYIKNCKCDEVNQYIKQVLKEEIRTSKEIKLACQKIKEEFEENKIYIDMELYEKYIKIGYLFFKEVFLYQKFLTAICLCCFTNDKKHKTRWRKILILMGRGNGKDGLIAWWSCCLTSVYHGVQRYDVDIIANNFTQSLRPLEDIMFMCEEQGIRMKKFYSKLGDSVISLKTFSNITARSSDAKQQDGLRSGCVMFNEIHLYENYSKINVMITGLGKKEDPRQFYFTTNGEIRGGVLDDMLDTSQDILKGVNDKGFLPFIFKLDSKEEVHDQKNWVKANPSLPYRETLLDEIIDEYDTWSKNPDNLPAFMQKRMNLPEMPASKEVASWNTIQFTEQKYNYSRLANMPCVVGIDLSKTTDWTGVNFLFYDDDLDKFVCINHAFICANGRDLKGIKAPWQEWCNQGLATLVNENEVSPDTIIQYIDTIAQENSYDVRMIVIDEYKKGIMLEACERREYSLDRGNLRIIRPSNIAQAVPIIERAFINHKLIWNNRMLMWSCNNTCLIPWKPKSTSNGDLGNQLYGKINPRFRKTDPYMAFAHSMCASDLIVNTEAIDYTSVNRFISF